jgi:hypothetical protein
MWVTRAAPLAPYAPCCVSVACGVSRPCTTTQMLRRCGARCEHTCVHQSSASADILRALLATSVMRSHTDHILTVRPAHTSRRSYPGACAYGVGLGELGDAALLRGPRQPAGSSHVVVLEVRLPPPVRHCARKCLGALDFDVHSRESQT